MFMSAWKCPNSKFFKRQNHLKNFHFHTWKIRYSQTVTPLNNFLFAIQAHFSRFPNQNLLIFLCIYTQMQPVPVPSIRFVLMHVAWFHCFGCVEFRRPFRRKFQLLQLPQTPCKMKRPVLHLFYAFTTSCLSTAYPRPGVSTAPARSPTRATLSLIGPGYHCTQSTAGCYSCRTAFWHCFPLPVAMAILLHLP